MQLKNIDWIGLTSGTLLVAVVLLSLFNPWWQLRIGDFMVANFSPLNTDFSFSGITFLVPLLTAINVSCLLLLSISAALMIAYSVNPTKKYSRQLLFWSYKNPLAIVITFMVVIVALSLLTSFIANQYAHINFTLPIMGTSVIQIPSELLGGLSGAQIGIAVSGAFQWTFYLAIAAAVLCTATRLRARLAPEIPETTISATSPSIGLPSPSPISSHVVSKDSSQKTSLRHS
jgi:hypothetical protein